jgi:hypothetical protein
LLLGIAGELNCGVLAGASDMAALVAANRVYTFDGEGGIETIVQSSHSATSTFGDFGDAAQAG